MEISEFTLRIILLFLPGIISNLVLEHLTIIKDKGIFRFSIRAFILGFLSYFAYFLVLFIIRPFDKPDVQIGFFNALQSAQSKIDFAEVAWVCIISVALAAILSFALSRKFFAKVASTIGLIKEIPELNVWEHAFSASQDRNWVVIRDIKNDCMYQGWVNARSDTAHENELFLRDVAVFLSSTGEELYKIPGLFISRNKDDLTIEFQSIDPD
jgi:hypothetical protein